MSYLNIEIGKLYCVKATSIALPAAMGPYGEWQFTDGKHVIDFYGLFQAIVMVVGFRRYAYQSLEAEPGLAAILYDEKTYLLDRNQLEVYQEKP